jgi:hypothetical protein
MPSLYQILVIAMFSSHSKYLSKSSILRNGTQILFVSRKAAVPMSSWEPLLHMVCSSKGQVNCAATMGMMTFNGLEPEPSSPKETCRAMFGTASAPSNSMRGHPTTWIYETLAYR